MEETLGNEQGMGGGKRGGGGEVKGRGDEGGQGRQRVEGPAEPAYEGYTTLRNDDLRGLRPTSLVMSIDCGNCIGLESGETALCPIHFLL